ncbi:MAG: hypothetical protein ACYDCO_26900 [Armatimonadota bacterium]
MECPECGYVLSPFELECPRCKRKQARGSREPEVALPARSLEVARDAVGAFEVVPLFGRLAIPELGGALTALLSGAVLFNLLLVGAFVFIIYSVERFAPQQGIPPEGIALARRVLVIAAAFPAAALVGAIGMLRCRLWGFYLFHACAALPLLSFLFAGVLHWHVLWSLVLIVPSMLIFVLAMMRWNEFY